MARFTVTVGEVVVEADDEPQAWWKLARYFGKKADLHAADDPEYAETLGLGFDTATIRALDVPDTEPAPAAEPAPAPQEG